MTGHTFSCLIPAFNEAVRIESVLKAVIGHPRIAEVIVIDDGSSDGTGDIAREKGVVVIRTVSNQGKTKALIRGLKNITTSHVVLIDADLSGLTAQALTALIDPVDQGLAMSSISLRGNAPFAWRLIGIDYISGERVIPASFLRGKDAQLAELPPFGFEVFLNRLLIAEGAPIAVVKWTDVASPSKAFKRGFVSGKLADAAMTADILRTIGPIECMRQIFALLRLQKLAADG